MMMKRASWIGGESDFSVSMDICKVDKEQRMVHGWATLDNPDRQGDVVEAAASESAFSRFRGNIREMHDKIAAGRMVSYRPQVYIDKDGTPYNGVFVSAYVSKGAQSTWEKVLDGTLNAFSIKGPVLKYEHKFHEDLGKSLRHILDYDLEELSLVDSGGNQLANFVHIQKDADGNVEVSGMYEGVVVENVFLCAEDHVAETSSEETLKCQNGHEMTNIGWVEVNDSKSASVSKAVDEFYRKQAEGGVEEMADEKVEKAVDIDEVPTVEETEEEETVEEVEEQEETTEDDAEETDEEEPEVVEKDIAEQLAEQFTELSSRIAEGFATLTASIEKRLGEEVAAVEEKITEVTNVVNGVKEELSEVSKSVDGLEDETALRKSGDLGGSNEPVKKAGVWQGSIL